MPAKRNPQRTQPRGLLLSGTFGPGLAGRRQLSLELPEFLICALAARVEEANIEAATDERCTIENYIESELVNLITIRDIAELENEHPGFAVAVNKWLDDVRL
jgi:hypothetical protein